MNLKMLFHPLHFKKVSISENPKYVQFDNGISTEAEEQSVILMMPMSVLATLVLVVTMTSAGDIAPPQYMVRLYQRHAQHPDSHRGAVRCLLPTHGEFLTSIGDSYYFNTVLKCWHAQELCL